MSQILRASIMLSGLHVFSFAATAAQQSDSLASIPEFGVRVFVDTADIWSTELTELENRLRADVEAYLEDAGIRVNKNQSAAGLKFVWFQVEVGIISTSDEDIALTLECAVVQGVSLLREPTVEVTAKTWEISTSTTTTRDRMSRTLQRLLNERLERFRRDYFTYNQRRPPVRKK
jgi:glutamate-1-semialdehyde aminotransferase